MAARVGGRPTARQPLRPRSSREFLGPLVLGRDPRAAEALWELLFARSLDYGQKGLMLAAISAVDIACWDLKAQDAGLPLYRLLGAEPVESVECYWTGFYFGGEEPLERRWEREARGCLDEGFRAVKMKVGLGCERDAELVAALRGLIGPGVSLAIDANHAYTPVEAVTLARRVEEHGIRWFEEPVSPLAPEAYLEVKAKTDIPLAGGECEATRFGFERWFRRRALDYAQPDVCACGGISEAMKIAALGSLTGVHVTPHAWGSAVGQAAALHFYAARPRQPFTLTPESKLIECDRTENPFREAIGRASHPAGERPLASASGTRPGSLGPAGTGSVRTSSTTAADRSAPPPARGYRARWTAAFQPW